MVVFVNNQKREFTSVKSIESLLSGIEIRNTRGLAVAVNDNVVPKKDWTDFLLNENDRVTIIRATQGG